MPDRVLADRLLLGCRPVTRLTGVTLGVVPVSGDRAPDRARRAVLLLGLVALVAGAALGAWALVGAPPGPPEVVNETPVTAMDLRARTAVTSPTVVRDPTEPAFLAAATQGDAPGPGCALQASGDGGDSWVQLEAYETFPEGIGACYQPQAAFAADGRLVFSFVGMAGPPPAPEGVFAVASDDRGTFTQTRRVADLDTVTPRLAASATGIEIVWVEPVEDAAWGRVGPPWPIGPQVLAAAGDAAGVGDPVAVAEPETLVAAPTVAADPDGATAVAYYELPEGADPEGGVASLAGSGPWRLMVAVREPGGAFGEPVEVADLTWADQAVWDSELRADEEPPDALQPLLLTRWGIAEPGLTVQDGRICVAWTDGTETGLRALASCSDSGQSWSAPQPLRPAAEGRPTSWLPQVAISPSGRVQAVYYGRDETRTEMVDVWYAEAAGPGEAFTDPLRLNSEPSSPRSSPRPGWFGSRLGLASGTDAAVAMWADTRNAFELQPNQTLFSATVRTARAAARPLLWVAGGVIVLGLTMIGAAFVGRRATSEPQGDLGTEESQPAGTASR